LILAIMLKSTNVNLEEFDFSNINFNRQGFTADDIFGPGGEFPQQEPNELEAFEEGRPNNQFLSSKEANTSKNLWVSNIPNSMTQDEFDLVFWSIGEVHSCRMVSHPDGQPKGFGFVEYQKKSDAHTAIQLLNGRTFRGRQLIVKLTRSPGPKCRGRAPFTETKKRKSANNPSGMEFQESNEEKAFIKQEQEFASMETVLDTTEKTQADSASQDGSDAKGHVVSRGPQLKKNHVVSRGPVRNVRVQSTTKKARVPPVVRVNPHIRRDQNQPYKIADWYALNAAVDKNLSNYRLKKEKDSTFNNKLVENIRKQVLTATMDQLKKQQVTKPIQQPMPAMQPAVEPKLPYIKRRAFSYMQPNAPQISVPPGLGLAQPAGGYTQVYQPSMMQQATIQPQPWHRQYKPY